MSVKELLIEEEVKSKPPQEYLFHVVYKKNISDLYSTGLNVKAFSFEGAIQKLKDHADIKEESILFIVNKTNMDK